MLLRYDGPRRDSVHVLVHGTSIEHLRGVVVEYPAEIAQELLAETRHTFVGVTIEEEPQDEDTSEPPSSPKGKRR